MARVYVYSWDNTDYSTIGECGALDAISCTFEEVGNSMSEISLIHPIDALGKYTFLRPGAMLKVNVPVRTTPEIENGAFVTQVETWVVKQTATKQQRYVYSKKEGGRKTKTLSLGAEVVVTSKPADSERWKIKSGKVSGWIASSGLERSVEIIVPDNAAGIENAAPAWESREQLFRIYKVEKSDDGITCSARHPMYDLLQNMTTFDTNGSVTLQECGDAILENCIDPHDFRFFTDITGTQTGAHYVDTDPVSAFLNPESGLAAAWNAQLVRDNFDIFMLANAGMDRGTRIEYARNMLGVQMDEDIDSTATAIRPIGRKKDGSPLYLDGDGLVVSQYADQYPFKRIYKLECTDCTVGTNGVTEAIAKARMREQAEALLADGVDLPNISVRVTFASLGHTERYAQYRNLENVFLYDTVAVVNPRLRINVKTQVIRIMWDCLREKMVSVELGSLQALSPSVAGWQISGGISGGKLVQGSVGAAQLGSEAISARHVQAGSINTEALQAGSITSEKIAAGAITAEKLQADIIEAVSIDAVIAHIEKIVAENITTDRLYAALASFDILNAGTGNFDRATVEHLVANLFNLTGSGVMEDVFIHNLQLAYAQIVSASIGSLVLQDKNGGYYEIGINLNDDGTTEITASPVYPSEEEKINGVYGTTKPIIATQMTVDDMAATTVKATQAVINKVIAARIDVDELFANNAFINKLVTSNIVSGKSLTIISEEALKAADAAKNAAKTFRQETSPTQADNVKTGDIWVKPSTGEIYQANAISFALDDEGNLYLVHSDNDGYYAIISPDDPYFMEYNFDMSIAADGTYSKTPIIWSIVRDSGLAGQIEKNTTAGVDVEYCLWTSEVDAPYKSYSGWQTYAPEQTEGMFIWSRTATRLQSGVVFYSDPICISPSLGKNILSITEQYAIGSSKETVPDESAWKSTPDERGNGQYLWTRSLITFVDGTTTTTPPQVNTLWELEDSALDTKTTAENAGVAAAQAVADLGNIPNYIEEGSDGLYIKDIQGASTMKLNSGSVSIGTVAGAAQGFSQFAANYVQFGTYQLRRAADGGLVFRMV